MKTSSIYYQILIFINIIIFQFTLGCKKMIEVDPPVTSVNARNVYTSDATAISVLTGLYSDISAKSNYSSNGIATLSTYSGLCSDELTLFSGVSALNYNLYYKNALASTGTGTEYWTSFYSYIFICNSAIEGLQSSMSISNIVKQQLLGEAKFMRAFFYFYLINFYGDAPLILTTDYKVNMSLARTSKALILKQIIADLIDAKSLLNGNYLDGTLFHVTVDKIRPTLWAAKALLARSYLFNGNYAEAETQSTDIINSNIYHLTTLDSAFLKNNSEAIWQLQPVNSGWNTEDAREYILPAGGPSSVANPVYLSSGLINSFELNDNRKSKWVSSIAVGSNTYYYPYKYKSATLNASVTEYLTIFREAEIYLIRSEARAQLGNLGGASDDLNIIRARAGANLPQVVANTQQVMLNSIIHERQTELFTEWGHRWLDIKRSGIVNDVMLAVSQQKSTSWNSNMQLYPIPYNDILRDLSLIQNPGY